MGTTTAIPQATTALSALLRWCPVCQIRGKKVRITRQRPGEHACCKECGWAWEPNQ